MIKNVHTNKAPAAIGPYSQAVCAGGFIFVSGQLPINPSTGTVSPEAAAQARQSLENIKSILLEADSGLSKVVRCGIFLKNMEDFAAVNEVYGSYFDKPYPARSTVEVARLPKDVLVEIEAIALVP